MKSRILLVVTFVVVASAVFLTVSHSELGPKILAAMPFSDSDHNSEQQVKAVFEQMEKATREGNLDLSISLYDRETRAKVAAAEKNLPRRKPPANPDIRYEALAVAVRNDRAALIGKITGLTQGSVQYDQVRFVREDGAWKVAEEVWGDQPVVPAALYAMVPPGDGAFSRAGSPWERVAYSNANTKWFKPDEIEWRMQATQDESFLYIRFENKAPLPPPNSELDSAQTRAGKAGPPSPPVMRIALAGPEGARRPIFTLQLGGVTQTRATFDDAGHATSNRFFVQYSMNLSSGDNSDIFSTSTGQSYPQLIAVTDRFLETKIPLRCLGLDSKAATPLDLLEVNSLAKILPYHVQQFSP